MKKALTTRPSPSASRAVGIINFLAEHPQQAFKLTELQRALRLSRTTCHSVLLALVEAGYVLRSSDKTYTLGPALIEVGRAASVGTNPLQLAQPEMRRLADTYDMICSAVFREGDEMVVRDRAASVSHLGFSAPRGIRLKIGVPGSASLFAWGKAAEFDERLKAMKPEPSPDLRREMRDAVAFIHEHGFSFSYFEKPEGSVSSHASPGLSWHLDETGETIYREATKLEDIEYRAAVWQAPVFDSKARLIFNLTLTGATAPLRADEILRRGNDLRQACDRVTAAVGGRVPPVWSLAAE